MKKLLILTVILACCQVTHADDPNESVSLWLMGNNLAYQNSDLSLWVGYRRDNAEFGVASNWRMFSEGDTDEDTQSDFAIGPYAAYHFPGLIDINNPFADIEWMPDKLIGEPFLCLPFLFDTKSKGSAIAPMAGVRVFEMFSLSYQHFLYTGNTADNKGQVGISTNWKF